MRVGPARNRPMPSPVRPAPTPSVTQALLRRSGSSTKTLPTMAALIPTSTDMKPPISNPGELRVLPSVWRRTLGARPTCKASALLAAARSDLLGYLLLTQAVKTWLLRRKWM